MDQTIFSQGHSLLSTKIKFIPLRKLKVNKNPFAQAYMKVPIVALAPTKKRWAKYHWDQPAIGSMEYIAGLGHKR